MVGDFQMRHRTEPQSRLKQLPIKLAAICRANSLPIPDEAPVTSAQGPNLFYRVRRLSYFYSVLPA
jgi:hypothetical protein